MSTVLSSPDMLILISRNPINKLKELRFAPPPERLKYQRKKNDGISENIEFGEVPRNVEEKYSSLTSQVNIPESILVSPEKNKIVINNFDQTMNCPLDYTNTSTPKMNVPVCEFEEKSAPRYRCKYRDIVASKYRTQVVSKQPEILKDNDKPESSNQDIQIRPMSKYLRNYQRRYDHPRRDSK